MLIFDSAKCKKVEFVPIKDGEVRMYICGPTLYNDAHLGHAKSSVSFDLLRRFLINLGYKVIFAKNFTDIDDKILQKSKENSQSIDEITSHYKKRFLDEMSALNVLRPNIEPCATQSLDEIISYIQTLLNKNFAYRTNDGIYFDTSKDANYLSLSHKNLDDENLARIAPNEDKKNQKDFALWKFDDNFYDAPFGKGRPGWHSECVAMIKKHLSYENSEFCIDIHAGGMDLLFPHHENEAAQCRCAQNKILAKYWLHNGFVQVNSQKMSKSLGNSFFIKDALKIVPGEVLRFYLLSSHYRANFNYCIDDLFASKKRLDKIYRLKKRILGINSANLDINFQNEINEALNDDLNSSLALSKLDIMVNEANLYIDKNPKDKVYKAKISANLDFVAQIFGILQVDVNEYFQFGVSDEQKAEISSLIAKRNLAKKEKNFALCDEIRNKLLEKNISLLDTPNGTIWEKI